jgi:tetratricopeptide (TPR) repeat protein
LRDVGRDDAYRDRRPSLPSRSVRPGARTGSRDELPRRGGGARSDRRARELTPEEIERAKADSYGRGKGWGGVARKGGANLKSTGQAMEVTPSTGKTPDPLSKWVEEVRPTKSAPAASAKAKVKYALPGDVAADVRKAFIGTSYMREKMVMTLTRAAEAYDRKRYEEALRLGRIVSDAVPGVAPVRELTGLAAYRADRWSMAKIHLRAHFTITGDPEHLALVMDCDRANSRYRAVEKTFAELEGSEPTAEVLVEGRIVMASTLADQRMYQEAIELLTKAGATKQLRNPSFRHVRLWYALADVFDRAGDTASARELFARVVIAEPDAYDAQSRLTDLGATAPPKNRKRRTVSVSKKKVD